MRGAFTPAALAAVLIVTGAAEAQAHAHLTGTEPAADATIAAPRMIALRFSEKLQSRFSGFELSHANGAKLAVKAGVGKDGKTLTGAPARPLAPGVYRITWHAVGADTHRLEGAFSFRVR